MTRFVLLHRRQRLWPLRQRRRRLWRLWSALLPGRALLATCVLSLDVAPPLPHLFHRRLRPPVSSETLPSASPFLPFPLERERETHTRERECVCLQSYVHVYIFVCVWIDIHTPCNIYVNVYIDVYAYIYVCVYIYIYDIPVLVRFRMVETVYGANAHTDICARRHTCAHVETQSHTYA
jgi:hypothetical protein